MLFDKYRYVVVEGPIGVGKTSLVHRLAQYVGATTLLEKPDENPFLAGIFHKRPSIPIIRDKWFASDESNVFRFPVLKLTSCF